MSTTEKSTASDLRQQVANADEALAGLQTQIDGVQAEMTRHEDSVTAITQAHHERQAAMGMLQLHINAGERDLKALQATSVITRNTSAQQRTLDDIAALVSRQAEMQAEMQRLTVADEDQAGLDQQAEGEHEQVYGGLQEQLAELQQQKGILDEQRTALFAELGTAEYAESAELIASLEDALARTEGQGIQYQQALLVARLDMKRKLQPWYSLAQQAERELHLSQKPDDSTARVLKALLAYLDALEQDGVYLPAMIDGRFLVNELALDGTALQALLKRDREPIDRANDFRHRRSQLEELLQKHSRSR